MESNNASTEDLKKKYPLNCTLDLGLIIKQTKNDTKSLNSRYLNLKTEMPSNVQGTNISS